MLRGMSTQQDQHDPGEKQHADCADSEDNVGDVAAIPHQLEPCIRRTKDRVRRPNGSRTSGRPSDDRDR